MSDAEMPIEQVEAELKAAGITGVSFRAAGKLFRTIAEQSAEIERLRHLLTKAHDQVCSNLCPSVFHQDAPNQPRHCEFCSQIAEALTAAAKEAKP